MKGIHRAHLMIYVGSFIVWSLLCFGHYYLRTLTILSGPHDGDLYAYSWSYQAIMFLIFLFPIWILILGLVYFLEAFYFIRKQKSGSPGKDK
jgi:hypothetical protein